MYSTSHVWATKDSTGRTHVVNADLPKTMVPKEDEQGVTEKTVAICGTTVSGGYHRFKGFDNHRGLDFCNTCKRLIEQGDADD